jgi:hypothetical protein
MANMNRLLTVQVNVESTGFAILRAIGQAAMEEIRHNFPVPFFYDKTGDPWDGAIAPAITVRVVNDDFTRGN